MATLALTTTFSNRLLEWGLRAGSPTQPPATYLALGTTYPDTSGAWTEVTGNNYARELVTWAAAANQAVVSDADVDFNVASGNWGYLAYCAIYDSVSGGVMLARGTLDSPRSIATMETIHIDAGDITFYLR